MLLPGQALLLQRTRVSLRGNKMRLREMTQADFDLGNAGILVNSPARL